MKNPRHWAYPVGLALAAGLLASLPAGALERNTGMRRRPVLYRIGTTVFFARPPGLSVDPRRIAHYPAITPLPQRRLNAFTPLVRRHHGPLALHSVLTLPSPLRGRRPTFFARPQLIPVEAFVVRR
ncbi:MAG: hypothetical protein HYU66_02730 [Armatimonadetes bacterium]|nr:hypothetical protein [Armatimonadota bacterium]